MSAPCPEQRLQRLNEELREASTHTILRVAHLREFRDRLCYVSSFGTESAVMLSLLADIDPGFPVLFIDTGMHFRHTLDYREQLTSLLGLTNVREVRPDPQMLARDDSRKMLWKSDADSCCQLRKVTPLQPALEGYDAWITGRKRFHGGARSRLPIFEYAQGRFKVNPLANWDLDEIEEFFRLRQLPEHPLSKEGYRSVGCWPCTVPGDEGSDVRSGRWRGIGKTECGLHKVRVQPQQAF